MATIHHDGNITSTWDTNTRVKYAWWECLLFEVLSLCYCSLRNKRHPFSWYAQQGRQLLITFWYVMLIGYQALLASVKQSNQSKILKLPSCFAKMCSWCEYSHHVTHWWMECITLHTTMLESCSVFLLFIQDHFEHTQIDLASPALATT